MNPCELNAIIAAITNQLYASLSRDQFLCASLFLNELSKSMISMAVFRDICDRNNRGNGEKHGHKEKKP